MGVVRNGFIVAAFAVAGIATTGCQNKLAKENKALWAQNREQQSKINELWNGAAKEYDSRPSHGFHSPEQEAAWRDALRRLLPAPPAETMNRLQATLDLKQPVEVRLHAIQAR